MKVRLPEQERAKGMASAGCSEIVELVDEPKGACPGGVTHRVRTHPGGVPALAGLTPRSSVKVKATPAGW